MSAGSATRRRTAALALLAALALVAVACGQKPGVHAEGPGTAAGDSGAGPALGQDDLAGDPSGGPSGDTAGGTGGGTVGDTRTGSGADGATGGTAGADGAGSAGGADGDGTGGPADGGSSDGGGGDDAAPAGPVWGGTIVIGIHAPVTGAAPLPASFTEASQVYPRWINGRGGIHGRQVEVVIADDEYKPGTASQRCRELVQQDNAFLLVGGGGTDQIQACARTAAQLGVPYLSAGVTERGLRELKNYFAVSMSYPQQGPYLARYMAENFPDRMADVAMVYSDSPNFADARDAFVGAVDGEVREYRAPRSPSDQDMVSIAGRMCRDGVRLAYPLLAPRDWLTMAGTTAQTPACDVQWAGVGLTMGLNTVASTGCRANRSVDGATFFSPFPGVDRAPEMDPDFAAAVDGEDWDDIYVAVWAVTKTIGELIRAAGPDLTRAGFVASTEQVTNLQTGLNPVLSFTPDDHFGARQVHVLRADCDQEQYVTVDTFARY